MNICHSSYTYFSLWTYLTQISSCTVQTIGARADFKAQADLKLKLGEKQMLQPSRKTDNKNLKIVFETDE